MNLRAKKLAPVSILLALSAVAARDLRAVAGPWVEKPQVAVRLVSGWSRARVGDDAALGLEFRLTPGWHVYWSNPGDAGYPPQLTLEAGSIRSPELLFPAPERFDLAGGLVAFGYADRVVYPVDGELAGSAAGLVTIRGSADFLVCAESCIPYRSDLVLELPAGESAIADPELGPRLTSWRGRVPKPLPANGPQLDQRVVPSGQGGWTLLWSVGGAGLSATSPDLFFDTVQSLALGRPVRDPDFPGIRFRVPISLLDESKPPAATDLRWTLGGATWQGIPVSWQGETLFDPRRPTPADESALEHVAMSAVALVLIALLVRRWLRTNRIRSEVNR